MRDFTFSLPTRIVFGTDAELAAGQEVRRLGARCALVLSGGASARRSGAIGRVLRALEEAGVEAVDLSGVRPNPGSDFVRQAIDVARGRGCDVVIGVGGGSVIDTAKAVAAGVPYAGDFWDFFSGVMPVRVLPVGVVSTVAASGSECSADAVITNDQTHLKREMNTEFVVPRFALMNPQLTVTLPRRQTACGLMDIFSHLLERYLTRTADVEVGDAMLVGLMRAVVEDSHRVLEHPDDVAVRANVMWAATLAHADIAGVDREQDWATHDIEYALTSRYGCAHGAGLAAIMPEVLAFGLARGVVDEHGVPCAVPRLARLAREVWGCHPDGDEGREAREGIACFRRWIGSLGLPGGIAALVRACPERQGEDRAAAIREMAHETCCAGGRGGTVGGYVALGEQDVAQILAAAW